MSQNHKLYHHHSHVYILPFIVCLSLFKHILKSLHIIFFVDFSNKENIYRTLTKILVVGL